MFLLENSNSFNCDSSICGSICLTRLSKYCFTVEITILLPFSFNTLFYLFSNNWENVMTLRHVPRDENNTDLTVSDVHGKLKLAVSNEPCKISWVANENGPWTLSKLFSLLECHVAHNTIMWSIFSMYLNFFTKMAQNGFELFP